MSENKDLNSNTTLMSHFILRAPPPSVSIDVADKISEHNLYLRPFKPSYEQVLEELEKIGDDWHLRFEHINPKAQARSREKLEGKKASSWHFMKGDLVMGFCIAVREGFNGKMETVAPMNQLDHEDGTEIYKVGLYPEYTGKNSKEGYGHAFLPLVQKALLDGQQVKDNELLTIEHSDFIYLNTRPDTNTVDSRNFYKILGYEDAGEESWKIPTEEFNRMNEQLPVRKRRPSTPRSIGTAAPNDNNGKGPTVESIPA